MKGKHKMMDGLVTKPKVQMFIIPVEWGWRDRDGGLGIREKTAGQLVE